MEAQFTQYAPSGEISKGRFYLSRPGKLRFEYEEPNPMLIVAVGGMVYVHDAELKTTDSYPVGQTPLRFLLSKELDLEAAQVLSVREDRHGIKIVLAARDEELRGRLALLFEPENMQLAGWSFIDPGGQMTAVNLEGVEEKRRLPNRLFRVPESEGLFLSDN
nr:outer membrane lipoprotein carrier protein LolA [Parvularcula mediterranea]